MVQAVKDDDFESEVLGYQGYVLVDFWAEWCGPCKQMLPVMEKMSEELGGKLKIVKVNVDANHEVSARMMVRGIPAFFLFKNGEVISSKVGAMSFVALKDWIDMHVSSDA